MMGWVRRETDGRDGMIGPNQPRRPEAVYEARRALSVSAAKMLSQALALFLFAGGAGFEAGLVTLDVEWVVVAFSGGDNPLTRANLTGH
jgi:hypothetical protein